MEGSLSFRLLFFILLGAGFQSLVVTIQAKDQIVTLSVDGSGQSKKISDTMFGVFFEEINHAGAGGLWAELVSNRGFEAGGHVVPTTIEPWSIIGDNTTLDVSLELSSCFVKNKVALRMEVLCDQNACPPGGVGIYNPGFWGMNIEEGKAYNLVFYTRPLGSVQLTASLTSSDGSETLATTTISIKVDDPSEWKKVEIELRALKSNTNSRLQLTTIEKGVIFFDQVSLMPADTHNGHGFRKDLFHMVQDLKPTFLRFPGGSFVEGEHLRNAVRWKETIGPWEERSGHFGDVWGYWTDDGIGHYELLLLAEDLDALPVWVFNNGFSFNDKVEKALIQPFIQEALDGIEFTRGSRTTKWGSIRAAMGHPEPFDLRYVAVGNEECGLLDYSGNFEKFYSAIKAAYPDIKIISNCDGSTKPLNHTADLYDYHIYTDATTMFNEAHHFDGKSGASPKAFVSEYAVWQSDAAHGTLLASLGEAGFLIGLETNCQAIEMASYAPLFVNVNNRRWNPDAINFNSYQAYGTPSYWMQQFFIDSNGAFLLNSSLDSTLLNHLVASAITWKDTAGTENLKIKVVNFGFDAVKLVISISGLKGIESFNVTKTILTSENVMDENSFQTPKKVALVKTILGLTGTKLEDTLSPHSFTSFDLVPTTSRTKILGKA